MMGKGEIKLVVRLDKGYPAYLKANLKHEVKAMNI